MFDQLYSYRLCDGANLQQHQEAHQLHQEAPQRLIGGGCKENRAPGEGGGSSCFIPAASEPVHSDLNHTSISEHETSLPVSDQDQDQDWVQRDQNHRDQNHWDQNHRDRNHRDRNHWDHRDQNHWDWDQNQRDQNHQNHRDQNHWDQNHRDQNHWDWDHNHGDQNHWDQKDQNHWHQKDQNHWDQLRGEIRTNSTNTDPVYAPHRNHITTALRPQVRSSWRGALGGPESCRGALGGPESCSPESCRGALGGPESCRGALGGPQSCRRALGGPERKRRRIQPSEVRGRGQLRLSITAEAGQLIINSECISQSEQSSHRH
ncbi:hypothetical protein NQZ68_027066 [Dissostichus eleginoides]|nr:hypothetical protein NQZ68_027066 [Dissostichus eleginoides]